MVMERNLITCPNCRKNGKLVIRELSAQPETVMANLSLSGSVNSIFPAQEVGVSEEPDTTTRTRSVAIPTSAPSGNWRSSSIGTVGEMRCLSSRLVYPWLITQNTACEVIPKGGRGGVGERGGGCC